MKRGKKYRSVAEKREKGKVFSPQEAFAFLQEHKCARFDETVELHVRLGIDAKKGDQQVRGSVTLPHGTGKEVKVAVITSTAQEEAKKAGADLVAGEELLDDIKNGTFFTQGYSVLVATPEMMPKLASVAKILGPRGMMPSPKSDTVTTKVAEVITQLKKGKITFRNDNSGNIHLVLGKLSFSPEKLEENLRVAMDALEKARPEGLKGKYIHRVTVCSTMSPSLPVAV